MITAPSASFRRSCLALALLTLTWSLPGSVWADSYPLQNVKNVFDSTKPNVLIVLETAQSMQGLPGENIARYNEVGADCEEGNRFCRLVNQSGRYAFSGMGPNGMNFGTLSSTCTNTGSYTETATHVTTTYGNTDTTVNTTAVSSTTATGSGTGTARGTATAIATGAGWITASGSSDQTSTANGAAWTVTGYTTDSGTGKKPAGSTASAVATITLTGNPTGTWSKTTTKSSGTEGYTGNGTATASTPAIFGTVSATGTGVTATYTKTAQATGPLTGVVAVSKTLTVTGTVTVTENATATISDTMTVTVPSTGTVTQIGTGSATVTGTVSNTTTKTDTKVLTAQSLQTVTGTQTQTVTVTGNQVVNGTGTGNSTAGATASGTALGTASGTGNVVPGPPTATYTATGSNNFTFTLWFNDWSATQTSNVSGTRTLTYTDSKNTTGTNFWNWGAVGPSVLTMRNTANAADSYTANSSDVGAVNVTYTKTSTSGTTRTNTFDCPSGGGVVTCTTTSLNNKPGDNQLLGNLTGTFNVVRHDWNVTGTMIGNSVDVTMTGSVTGTAELSATVLNLTGTQTLSGTTGPGTLQATANVTASDSWTATMTDTQATITQTLSGPLTTGTGTVTTTVTTTATTTATTSGTLTETYPETKWHTCANTGNEDLGRCNEPPGKTTDIGFCYGAKDQPCTTNGACNTQKGDFCQMISAADGSGHPLSEVCKLVSPSSPSSWGKCKHGTTTDNISCDGPDDATHCPTVAADFCAEGEPVKMCSDTGLWCIPGGANCPGGVKDQCVPASSRMMTVKRALRRAVGEYADQVSFGFMSSYQGKAVNATDTDATTAIFPYVQVSCSGRTVTETRLVTRGELERGVDGPSSTTPCFSVATGPSSTCYIDYGGGDAINLTGNLNRIVYTKVDASSEGDSRWAIPRGDGSGHYDGKRADWSSTDCYNSPILPACSFPGTDGGTGLYEGSYYRFTYTQGTPPLVATGPGSLLEPVYFTTYKGKHYDAGGGNCYDAIDAERTEFVNDGVYGRKQYTLKPGETTPYATLTNTASGTATAVDTNRESTIPVPWSGADTGTTCGAKMGAVWNQSAVPFLSATSFNGKSVNGPQKALMIAGRLDKASFGGVPATGPNVALGCALNDAGSYMGGVTAGCSTKNIVLVVDGHSNGPGELNGTTIDCASDLCDVATNTSLSGCACAAITTARSMAQAGTTTHVVVNVPAETAVRALWQYTYKFMVNLAKAGTKDGSGVAAFGTTEEQVYRGISDKIAAAAYPFTYTTTVPVAGASTQEPTTLITTTSTLLFDTGVSYPSWRGTVRAFETASGGPVLTWDAASVAAAAAADATRPVPWWRSRRVFFSDKTGGVSKISISNTDEVTNAAELHIAGLGASADEAQRIVHWLLGKPGTGNPAPLMGPPTASTPIVAGQGAANGLSGAIFYSAATWQRPQLLYVGADDGMLHAFFTTNMTLGSASYQGGDEAFAFIPNDMLQVINKLYAQTRQNLAPYRNQHIFGLAGSPKVKDMCIGECVNSTGGGWHTVLVMTEGLGGNNPFAIDISDVVDASTGLHPEAMRLLWSAAPNGSATVGVKVPDVTDSQAFEYKLGETTSVPGFYFAGYDAVSGVAQNRLIFASGYPTQPRTGLYADQGQTILDVDATNGDVIHMQSTTPASNCSSDGYLQDRVLLGDVAIARNHSSEDKSQYLLGAYVGDTWGNAYQYVPGASPPVTRLYSQGCDQPIYFAPAVVQLDRMQKFPTSAKGIIYLAQVTNTNMDRYTAQFSSGSQIVVTKVDSNVSGAPTKVPYTATNDQIVLKTASTDGTDRICLQTGTTPFDGNGKTGAQTCGVAGGTPLQPSARPVGTPTAIMRSDGLGFQIITSWYDGDTGAGCSGSTYKYGTSYLTVHEFGVDGTWYQIAGVTLANTVLTGVAFVGTGLFIDGINTTNAAPGAQSVGESFIKTQQISTTSLLERYTRTTWSERVDL